MKQLIAKFLLCLYLFSFTPLKETLRIPYLVFHYQRHMAEDTEMSVIRFFSIHYLQGIILDEDHSQDMQLPFKNIQDFNTLPVFLCSELQSLPYLLFNTAFTERVLISTDQTHITKSSISGIFHPPRFV